MPNKTLTRAATLAPTTYDEKTHTIEVEVSTENVVHGVSLSHACGAVDLTRFIGAPFLNAHKRGDARDVLGVVTAARIESAKLIATVKLTRRSDAKGIIQDILDGITPQTSAGFTVSKWGQETVDPKTGARTRTATRWRPFEVSVVPYAADETRVRSEPANVGANRSNPMPKKSGASPAPEADVIDAPANESTVTQTRAEIRGILRSAGAPVEEQDRAVDEDWTLEQTRAAAYELMQARSERIPAPVIRTREVGPSPEERVHLRAAGFAAHYLGVPLSDERARQFANQTVEEQFRDELEARGIRTRGMNREAIMAAGFQVRNGGHTTSDYPLMMMLDTGVSSAVRQAFEAHQSPLVPMCFKDLARDFRTQVVHQLGEFSKLTRVPESGEIKSMTRGEAKESWSVDTYAGMFAATRKLIINDAFNQLGAFARDAGQAAANTAADLVVTELAQASGAGPVMGDGTRLFHADHKNLNSEGLEIDEGSISAARVAMLTQTGVDGTTLINVRPDTLVVPPSLLTKAEKLVASIQPATTDAVNVFSQKLAIVCEPRLEAISPYDWYLADSRHPALVLGGLAGNEGPQVSARDGWEILGREWRVTLDVGVGPRDWRGWFRMGGHTDSNSAGE